MHQIKLDPIIPNDRRHLLKSFASFIWNDLLEWKSNLMWTRIFSFGHTPYYLKPFESFKSSCFTEKQTYADCCDYPWLCKVAPEPCGGSWDSCCRPSACRRTSGQPRGRPALLRRLPSWAWRRPLRLSEHSLPLPKAPFCVPVPVPTSGSKTTRHRCLEPFLPSSLPWDNSELLLSPVLVAGLRWWPGWNKFEIELTELIHIRKSYSLERDGLGVAVEWDFGWEKWWLLQEKVSICIIFKAFGVQVIFLSNTTPCEDGPLREEEGSGLFKLHFK